MPKSATNIGIKVKIDIRPGGAASAAQKALWRKWWQRIIAEVKSGDKDSV
jgi:hypothetical protein